MSKLAVFLLLIGAGMAQAQTRAISEKDLFDFVWIGDAQVSPDGSRVAFVRVTVNAKKEGYDTAIWAVSTHGESAPYPLTRGPRDSAPRWSPDGKFLAFARATEKDTKPEPPQLAMLPLAGGDSFTFTDLPKGAGDPAWSPDGETLVFSSSTNAEDLAKQARKKNKEAAGKDDEARESDVHVVTRAEYRDDGEGYLDAKRPRHLWRVAAPHGADEKVQPQQLTFGRFGAGNAVWSNDSAQIYFTALRTDEPYYDLRRTELYSVPAEGGAALRLNTFDMGVSGLSLSPDGRQFAFVASTTQPVNSYTQSDLWVVELAPDAKPRNLTAGFDSDLGSGAFGDNAAPRGGGGNKPLWSPDGRRILDIYGKHGRNVLAWFDARSGAVTDLTQGAQAVLRFRQSADGSKIVYVVSSATRINELFALERKNKQRQLTRLNEPLFTQLNLSEPEEIWYPSFDGRKVQAWIQKPPGFDPAKKYPLILNIHGGPHAAYGYVFQHEFQWMAARGYVVLYPNPRGSTTYGQEFGNLIQYRYPGDDYKDLMAGVDALIERGYIDTNKLGVTGGSGGGLLTNWAVTQTTRFAAAVSQRDIADWSAWWYTSDYLLFQPTWFKAPPFEDEADFRARSPITHVKNVQTPMMFILGEADARTPAGAGGEGMFRALKFRKIPTVMVSFPNESHDLSRSGQPWHRIERLQHIVGWFDRWLLGLSKPEYDVAPPQNDEEQP